MSTAQKGRSSDASDRTVRDEANTAAATADSVADEANALLDDNPFEQPRYAFRPRTHDLRARLRTADVSPAKDPEAALEPYDLPAKGSRRSEEERKWARALLLSSPDWAGLPDDKKDFNAAVLFFVADWKEKRREGRQEPTASFVADVLFPLWRTEMENEPPAKVTDILANTNSDTKAYKGLICRLADGSEPPDLLADTIAPLASVPLPLTEEALRLHSALMEPTAKLIDASGHHGSIASSMHSTTSASSFDGVENATLCPRLNQYIYIEKIPDDQAAAASDEATRFISRRGLEYAIQLAHVIPKRPSNGPLVFALRSRIFLVSGAVPLSWYINHASNLVPLHQETHTGFDSDYIALTPKLSTLERMLRVVTEAEEGTQEPWERWLKDDDFRRECVPLELEVIVLVGNLVLPPALIVYSKDGTSETFHPQSDGTYRLAPGGKRLAPQPVERPLPDHLRHRQPNPFLFAISTAIKVILQPTRPLPVAFTRELVLCLELFVRLFRNCDTRRRDSTLTEAAVAAAHEWATPAKKRGKESDMCKTIGYLKGPSVKGSGGD